MAFTTRLLPSDGCKKTLRTSLEIPPESQSLATVLEQPLWAFWLSRLLQKVLLAPHLHAICSLSVV